MLFLLPNKKTEAEKSENEIYSRPHNIQQQNPGVWSKPMLLPHSTRRLHPHVMRTHEQGEQEHTDGARLGCDEKSLAHALIYSLAREPCRLSWKM